MTYAQNPFDREPVFSSRIEDLDPALILNVMRRGIELRRFALADVPELTFEALRAGSEEALLHYLERYGGAVWFTEGSAPPRLVPTVAGVLAFTQVPDRWIQSSGVDIATYGANPRLLPGGDVAVPPPTKARVEPVRGPIFRVIDRTVEILQDACSMSVLEGARVVTHSEMPLNVLRELTTNGVVHRDLRLFGAQVRIQIFPGSIEWISPGRLPPEQFPDDVPITIGLLLKAQYARNPALAVFLFHGGYIEKFGFGLDDVVASLTALGRDAPMFHNDTHSFRVQVARAKLQTEQRPPRTKQAVREKQILILFGETEIWTPSAIERRLKIPRTTLQKDLWRLEELGVLTAEGATNNRIYRLSDSATVSADKTGNDTSER